MASLMTACPVSSSSSTCSSSTLSPSSCLRGDLAGVCLPRSRLIRTLSSAQRSSRSSVSHSRRKSPTVAVLGGEGVRISAERAAPIRIKHQPGAPLRPPVAPDDDDDDEVVVGTGEDPADPLGWDRRGWQQGYRSQLGEYSYWIDEIDGRIPADLNGTYMRNGPGKFEVGTDRVVHPFDGDGLVASFSLQNSRAYFRCRYVRTAGYEAELAAGKVLFRNSFGTQRKGGFAANLFDVSQKNVANTNVVAWGGKCLALWEAMQPHGLDPYTLETYGVETLGGILHEGLPFSTGVEFLDKYGKGLGGDPLSAHPHVDHATNRLVTFGSKFVSARNLTHGPVDTNVTFYEFDDKFGLAHKRELRIPGFAFAHDFCFTENYYLLYQAPVRYDPLPFVFGLKGPAECLKFLPNRPCKVHLIPRPDGKYKDKAPMVIDAGSCFVFHHANAFEQEDGTIIVDSIVLPTLNDFGMIASSDYLDIDWATVPENRLWRHRIDVNKKEVTARQMSKRIVEFPTINGAAFGKKHRYIYCGASRHPTRNQPFGTWVKFDVDTGATSEFSLGRSHFFQEPEFVSRPNPTSEDDGWLMGLVYDSIEDRTDLVILDAKDMEAGPVATCHLKHHVPYGLHGNYVGEYYGPEQ